MTVAVCSESGHAAAPRAADWLCLAAAPTFAIMALLAAVHGGGQMAMMCSAAPDASPLDGMVAMYLLMSAFHTAPWLKLISSRRRDVATAGREMHASGASLDRRVENHER